MRRERVGSFSRAPYPHTPELVSSEAEEAKTPPLSDMVKTTDTCGAHAASQQGHEGEPVSVYPSWASVGLGRGHLGLVVASPTHARRAIPTGEA